MAWIVVEFLETKECKAVPIDWVVDGANGDAKCHYPPNSIAYKEMLTLLKKCRFPQSGWEEHMCRVFKKSKTDNYLKALELEKEAEISSGLDESRSLGNGLRKKRKAQTLDDEEESPFPVCKHTRGSSSSDEDNATGKVPPPPRLNQVRHHQIQDSPGVSVDAVSHQSGSSSSDEDNATGKVPPPPRLNQVGHQIQGSPGVSVDAFTHQSGKQLNPQTSDGKEGEAKRPATVEELYGFMQAQEKVWEERYRRLDEKLSMAISMLKELKEEMMSKPVTNEDCISVNQKFPLKNLDDVEELERELSEDASLHNNLVAELARHCGDEEQSSVYKLLYFVLTDEAAKHFCLTGKSGVEGTKKKKFMGTRICNVIMDVFSRKSALAHMSTAKIERKMGEWFRQTGTRMKRVQLKAPNDLAF